jgi:ATP-dependent Clp protease ATP-binding subunit ClpC
LLSAEEIKMSATAELKKIMSPELLNRIDDIVVFEVLTEAEIAAIFDIEFYELQKRILDLHIHLEISANAKKYFIKNGYDPVFGARPMRRLIQKEIEDVLATKIIEGSFSAGDQVRVEMRGEALMLKIIQKASSASKDLSGLSDTLIETSSEEKEITKV